MTTIHRITTTAAVVLSVAAAGAPMAMARPDFAPAAKQPPPSVYSGPDKLATPVTTPNGDNITRETSAQPPVVRVQTPRGGFDWGDAGIGAAGGVALAMLGLGGGLTISRRPRRTGNTTVLSR